LSKITGCWITPPQKKGWSATKKRISLATFASQSERYGQPPAAVFHGGRSGVFTAPWCATITYGRVRPVPDVSEVSEWEENVCAENPHQYDTKDAAVPTADKPDFRGVTR
jgi:hypothetical protein